MKKSVRFYVSQKDIDIGIRNICTATQCMLATSLTRHGYNGVSVGVNVGSIVVDGNRKHFVLSPKSTKAIEDALNNKPVKPFHARFTFEG